MSLTEARKRFFQLADDVQKLNAHFFLTKNGKAKVVLMSADQFDSWQETVEIMKDSQLVKEIRRAHEDFENGEMEKFVTWGEMQKALGWKLADKSDKKYVSSNIKKRGGEKSREN